MTQQVPWIVEVPEFVGIGRYTPPTASDFVDHKWSVKAQSKSRFINPRMVIELSSSTPDTVEIKYSDTPRIDVTGHVTSPISVIHLVDHEHPAPPKVHGFYAAGAVKVAMSISDLTDLLWPPPCPDARATGVAVQVTHGVYELQGDCGGDRYISSANGAVVLDPARLVGDEWTVARIADTDGRHRFSMVITAPTTFTLQRWVPPAEPDGTGSWNDVTATVADVQAQTRLRARP